MTVFAFEPIFVFVKVFFHSHSWLSIAIVFVAVVSPEIIKPLTKRFDCHATSNMLAGTLYTIDPVSTVINLIAILRTIPW